MNLTQVNEADLRDELRRRERIRNDRIREEEKRQREIERARKIKEENEFRESVGISEEDWPKVCQWFYDRLSPDQWGDTAGLESW